MSKRAYLLSLTLFLLFLPIAISAATLYVPADHATIQAAVTAANPNDTIIISGGPYPERVTVNKAGLTLQGDGTYPTVNPVCTNGQEVIRPAAAGITIRGLRITNAGGVLPLANNEARGIWDGSFTTGYDNLTIDDCIIHDIDCGIRAYGRNLTITNCELYRIKLAGIHASGNDGSPAAPFTITNNWCHDWIWYTGVKEAYGISIRYDNRVGEISYNYCSGMRMGISYYYGGPRPGLGQVIISHNTIDLDYDPGTETYKTTMGISFWGTGDNCNNIIIRDNIFANCRWYALYQEGGANPIQGSFQIYNNLFFNNNWVYYTSAYPYQWFGDETYAQAGWYDPPVSAFTFTNNMTAKDPLFRLTGVRRDQWRVKPNSPALFAASDGTNIGACQELPPFTVYVDDDYSPATPGWQVDHFNTIQDAIEEVFTTGTVVVHAGRYGESVIVDRGIHLEGNGIPFIDGEPTSAGLTVLADNASISGFAINNFQSGIDIATSSGITISDCYIFNNLTGLRNQCTAEFTNATPNWWGDNSGPAGTGNPVSGYVLYDPWIGQTGRLDGAQDFIPGGTGIVSTGTGRTELQVTSSSAAKSSLILATEAEGAFPQGKVGFAGEKAVNRRLVLTPYYLSSGQFQATLKLYYTPQDLADAGIPDGSWLSIRVWDSGTSKWVYAVEKNVNPATENIHRGDNPPDAILGHYGTYTAGGYAWANIDHFSEFAVGQDPTVPVELSIFSLE